MWKIVDGWAFEGKHVPGEFDLTVHELGHGHREVVVRQVVAWEEVGKLSADELELVERRRVEEEAERREANRKRACRRAKVRVRRLVKSMGCDSLLTLTYRANQTDRALCLDHLRRFVERVRRVLPGFAYVAALERQERGAWHVHLAIHRLPRALSRPDGVRVKSWDVVRAVWRSVVGELGGTINERRRKWASGQSARKLAAYLSKYMMKAFDDGDDWSKRFSSSRHSLPEPVRQRFAASSMGEMIALAYAFGADGPCEIGTFLQRWGELFFLSSEVRSPRSNPERHRHIDAV